MNRQAVVDFLLNCYPRWSPTMYKFTLGSAVVLAIAAPLGMVAHHLTRGAFYSIEDTKTPSRLMNVAYLIGLVPKVALFALSGLRGLCASATLFWLGCAFAFARKLRATVEEREISHRSDSNAVSDLIPS